MESYLTFGSAALYVTPCSVGQFKVKQLSSMFCNLSEHQKKIIVSIDCKDINDIYRVNTYFQMHQKILIVLFVTTNKYMKED